MTRFLGALAALTLLLVACSSDEEDFRDQLRAFDPSITDEMVDCIITELDGRGLSVSDISDEAIGDGPIPAGAQEAFTECILASIDDELPIDPAAGASDSPDSASSGSAGSGAPDTYGDDQSLDELWDTCEAGDGAACDDLYFQSPVGSDYEDFGNRCGRRFEESPGFCEDALS